MHISHLLARLQKVKPTGHDEWVACCPAHEDKSPSLAVKDSRDGRILLHCFAGCSTEAVLDSIGFSFSDVMPERLAVEGLKPLPWNPRTVLEAVAHDCLALALLMQDMANSDTLPAELRDDVYERAMAIQQAARYATR